MCIRSDFNTHSDIAIIMCIISLEQYFLNQQYITILYYQKVTKLVSKMLLILKVCPYIFHSGGKGIGE